MAETSRGDVAESGGDRIAVVIGGLSRLPPRALAPWLAAQEAMDRIGDMSRAGGIDLVHLGTVATQGELAGPATSRPLATALAVLVGESVVSAIRADRLVLAGHGTGEIAAAVLAGVLDTDAGLELAVRVGRAEAAAAAMTPGGQVALLGGYPQDIEDQAAALGLSVAAYNGGGDMAVAGPPPAVDTLLKDPPPHTRAEPLPAIGAFCSELMAPVAAEVRATLPSLTISQPRLALRSGRDGREPADGASYLEGLASQLTGPVRWDMIMESLATDGIRVIMELPPARALSGLVVRGLPGVAAVPVNTPEVLADAVSNLVIP